MWLSAVFKKRFFSQGKGVVVLALLGIFAPLTSQADGGHSRGLLDARAELHGYSLQRAGAEHERVSSIVQALQRSADTAPVTVAIAVGGRAVNALALSNREIVVYEELLRRVRDEDELAAVLAHELAHLITEHCIFMPSQRGLHHSETSSERAELDADLLGIQLMARAGYDPRAAIGLWERALDIFPNPAAQQRGASSHPAFTERKEALLQALPAALREYKRYHSEESSEESREESVKKTGEKE
jgi:predicted Zn-dependent protease